MKYEIDEKEGVVIIALKGKVTAGADLEKLHGKINELVRIGARRMVIDLGEVPHMDTSGLRVFVSVLKGLRSVGGDLKLVKIMTLVPNRLPPDPPPGLLRFEIYRSAEEAVKSFQAASKGRLLD